tara:strand:+ start:20981 stop:21721 length:741 start_codon:yes stop_codon:yes gene_type:complete
MKLAICFSGIVRGQVERNIEHVKNAMPEADLFYATWEEQQNDMSKKLNCVTYPEPVLKYNSWTECVEDNPHHKFKQYKIGIQKKSESVYTVESLNHSTKQILAHAYQVRDLPEEYDMVVRIRWDTVCGSRIKFDKYVDQSYNEQIAIGFSIRGGRYTKMNAFYDIPHKFTTIDTHLSVSRDWSWWLNDNLIIHPRKKFDPEKVFQYDAEKRLWPAEYGWYQMLSENNDHHCVYGGAAIERFVRDAI